MRPSPDCVSFDPRGVGASAAIDCDVDLDDDVALVAPGDRQAWDDLAAEAAVAFLESLERRPATSVICVAELMAGVRDAQEEATLQQFLLAFEVLPV